MLAERWNYAAAIRLLNDLPVSLPSQICVIVSSNLTLHGVTKSVTMDLWYRGTITNPMTKKDDAGFKLSGTINRKDFGIAPNAPNAMLSEDVTINANGEFGKVN